jgi:hypothetical protein
MKTADRPVWDFGAGARRGFTEFRVTLADIAGPENSPTDIILPAHVFVSDPEQQFFTFTTFCLTPSP